jgi:hypothetical protein
MKRTGGVARSDDSGDSVAAGAELRLAPDLYRRLPEKHRLSLLWLDWSGARVQSIEKTFVVDYDQTNRRVRLRKATTKGRCALWIELPDVLADAIEVVSKLSRERGQTLTKERRFALISLWQRVTIGTFCARC